MTVGSLRDVIVKLENVVDDLRAQVDHLEGENGSLKDQVAYVDSIARGALDGYPEGSDAYNLAVDFYEGLRQ